VQAKDATQGGGKRVTCCELASPQKNQAEIKMELLQAYTAGLKFHQFDYHFVTKVSSI
jgi:hypothetical protein